MGRTTKDHKGLDFTKERLETKPLALTINVAIVGLRAEYPI